MLAILFVVLATNIDPGPPPGRGGPAVAALLAVPVQLDPEHPERRRVGDLVFLRGWVLTSGDPRFGGVSAMQIEGDGVTAISDAGTVFEFALPGPNAPRRVRVLPIPLDAGTDRRGYDTELLQIRGDEAWIGFERSNSVARFRRAGWRLEATARPAPMRGWLLNSGPEAMVRLPDGRFLVFEEGRDDGTPFSGVVLFDGDPAEPGTRTALLRYRRPIGFRATDAALLPDGRLLILNRRVSWFGRFSARLVLVDAPDLRPGATLEGHEIAELRSPLTVDNMEALSVASAGGRTIVWIASDDNFMPASSAPCCSNSR